MLWATSELIHFDRVAAAWAIQRFVDADADFVFIRAGEPVPDGATPFGLPSVPLGVHDEHSSTFKRVLDRYELATPALDDLVAMVDAVVRHVMEGLSAEDTAQRSPEAIGMLAVAEGIMILSADDAACLALSIPVYDALLARLEAKHEVAARYAEHPVAERPHDAFPVAHATASLRKRGLPYSRDAFADALPDSLTVSH